MDVFIEEAVRINRSIGETEENQLPVKATLNRQMIFFLNFDEQSPQTSTLKKKLPTNETISRPRLQLNANVTMKNLVLHQLVDCLYKFPFIKRLFRLHNATVLSSPPVERFFSRGSLISVPRGNRLTDERFEQLLLLNSNRYAE